MIAVQSMPSSGEKTSYGALLILLIERRLILGDFGHTNQRAKGNQLITGAFLLVANASLLPKPSSPPGDPRPLQDCGNGWTLDDCSHRESSRGRIHVRIILIMMI